ncbi:MAG: hypothetical protein ACOYNR_13160 [Blastocatellia bacterium]
MRTSRKLTHYLMAVFAVAMMSMSALAADPGTAYPQTSEASDQKAGSLLVYTLYQSNATNVAGQDTKINITNTNESNPIIVHFFFVNTTCSVADFKTELTANQTYSFLTSDFDPGTTGYIMAIAENYLGVPIHFNFLIGDLYTRSLSAADSYQANLGAIAFSALWTNPNDDTSRTTNVQTGARQVAIQIPGGDANAVSNVAGLDGRTTGTPAGGYNRLPATLALSNIPSRASNDRTLLVVLRPTGDLLTGMNSVGSIFGLLFDDAEQSQSFVISGNRCHEILTLSNNTPRTVPRFDSVIPAGRTGWMKFWVGGGSTSAATGILGSMIVYNQQARVNFEGGHNLHHLTLVPTGPGTGLGTSGAGNTITIPVFPFTGN